MKPNTMEASSDFEVAENITMKKPTESLAKMKSMKSYKERSIHEDIAMGSDDKVEKVEVLKDETKETKKAETTIEKKRNKGNARLIERIHGAEEKQEVVKDLDATVERPSFATETKIKSGVTERVRSKERQEGMSNTEDILVEMEDTTRGVACATKIADDGEENKSIVQKKSVNLGELIETEGTISFDNDRKEQNQFAKTKEKAKLNSKAKKVPVEVVQNVQHEETGLLPDTKLSEGQALKTRSARKKAPVTRISKHIGVRVKC